MKLKVMSSFYNGVSFKKENHEKKKEMELWSQGFHVVATEFRDDGRE
jgi:hypothetical protein